MPANTPNRNYPYPIGTDPIDTAGDIERLAKAVDLSVDAIGDELGTNPSGPYNTVQDRLNAVDSAFNTQINFRVFASIAARDAWVNPPFGAIAQVFVAGVNNPLTTYHWNSVSWVAEELWSFPGALFVDAFYQAEVVRMFAGAANKRIEFPGAACIFADTAAYHVFANGVSGEPFIRQSLTGVGDPKYFFDIGSRNDVSAKVVIRFLGVNRIEASVPWPVASTRAIKTNIEPTSATVLDLHPVSYQRTDGVLEGRTLLGFVVEDLVTDLPEAVLYGGTEDPEPDENGNRAEPIAMLDEPIGYMSEVILAAAVQTIQSQQARIEALEAFNTQLVAALGAILDPANPATAADLTSLLP